LVMFAGQVKEGGWVSFTVTVKLHVLLLPLPSVAVQVTVTVPLLKALPLAGLQTTVAPEQVSLAVAIKVTLLAQVLPEVPTTMLAGQVMFGLVVSTTVTVKEPVPVLPWPSLAEQLTGVLPRLKALPDAGLQVIATDPAQVSFALAL